MPDIEYALIANYAEFAGAGVQLVSGGIDTIVASQVPHVKQLGVVVSLGFTTGECGRLHRLELMFMDTDGQQIATATTSVNPAKPAPGSLPAGWPVRQGLALNLPVPFPRHGVYSVELVVNDTSRKSMRLRVVPPAGEVQASG